jgi:hypothetical protein
MRFANGFIFSIAFAPFDDLRAAQSARERGSGASAGKERARASVSAAIAIIGHQCGIHTIARTAPIRSRAVSAVRQ